MTFKFIDMPKGLLALMDDDGTITINAKHMVELDEVLNDENGMPTIREYQNYADAMDEYYSSYGLKS